MADQSELNAVLDVEQLDDFIGYNIKRIYLTVQADMRRVLDPHSLSPSAFATLSLVMRNPGITQSEVARQLGIERSGLVALVDKLENRDFVNRKPVPGDRRVQALHPTQSGRAAYQIVLRDVQAHELRMFGSLSDDERAAMLSMLAKLRKTSEEDME